MAEARTKAVEAAVAILLCVCGVSAAIGIFEAQEHRNAAIWFSGSAAALIGAVLIPVAVYLFFPWIAHLSGRRESRAITSAATAPHLLTPAPSSVPAHKTQVADQLPADNRIVVNVTPKDLTDFYVDRMDFEGDAAVERYLNKWMKIDGQLKNVVDRREYSRRWLGVYLELNPQLPTVSMFFNDQKWFDRLLVLRRGDPVSVLGRIHKVQRESVVLEDCELVEG